MHDHRLAILTLTLTSLGASLAHAADDYTLAWSYDYDLAGLADGINDVVIDAEGNIIVTGEASAEPIFGGDMVTIKLDPAGRELWTAVYDGPLHAADRGIGVALGADGSVHVTGQTDGDVGIGPDIITIRYAPDGTELWRARFNHPFDSLDRANDIQVGADGMVFVTGYSHVAGCCTYHYTTIAYDATGAEQWVAHHQSGDGLAVVLALDSAGHPVVTGYDEASFTTIKYDRATGAPIWTAEYDGGFGDQPFDLAIDSADNVYVTGTSGTSFAGVFIDWVTIKYDAHGQPQWLHQYNGPDGTIDIPNALVVDERNDRVIVVGSSTGVGTGPDFTTVSLDGATGLEQWTARIDGPQSGFDVAEDVAVDADGAVYVTGRWVAALGGIQQQLITSYAPDGTPRLQTTFGDPAAGFSTGAQIRLSACRTSIITGGAAVGDYSVLRLDTAASLGDLDGSGAVDFGDVVALLAAWGTCDPRTTCPADLDCSAAVDFTDLLALLARWGG